VKAFLEPVDLDLQHVRIIVQGMLRVAHSDGAHVRELVLIRQFYESCRADAQGLADFADLEKVDFDPETAREILNTRALRETFLGSCYLVAYADGGVSAGETAELAALALELDIDAETVSEMRERVKDQLLQQVAGSANIPALKTIARGL